MNDIMLKHGREMHAIGRDNGFFWGKTSVQKYALSELAELRKLIIEKYGWDSDLLSKISQISTGLFDVKDMRDE